MDKQKKASPIKIVILMIIVVVIILLIGVISINLILKSASNAFSDEISPEMKGILVDGQSKQPLSKIDICWKRLHEDGMITKIVDSDCTMSKSDGTFVIPSITGSGGATSITIYTNYNSRMPSIDEYGEYYQREYEQGRFEINLEFSGIKNKDYTSNETNILMSKDKLYDDIELEINKV